MVICKFYNFFRYFYAGEKGSSISLENREYPIEKLSKIALARKSVGTNNFQNTVGLKHGKILLYFSSLFIYHYW